jgi:acyl-CoA thioesterase FadM
MTDRAYTRAMTMARRFDAAYRVRFDEADANGHLRPSGYLRFAQDIAWQHSEAAGFAREWYAERSMHWLVRDVDLHILGTVTYGDKLVVTTEVIGWRHVWARRHAEVRLVSQPAGDGPLATVETDWVSIGDGGRPARLPAEVSTWLDPGRTFARMRLDLEPTPDSATRAIVHVRPSDVDPMGHLNNASYLDLLDEAVEDLDIADTHRPSWYRVSYHQPALRRTDVEVACWRSTRERIDCRISDLAGTGLTSVVAGWAGPLPR